MALLDEALVALAAAGGTAVVQAASTDAWTGFRKAVAQLLGRGNEQRASIALARLDETAAALEAADERGDDQVGAHQGGFWQATFGDLLESVDGTERDSVAADLRVLIEEQATPASANRDQVSGNTFNGPTALQTGNNNRQVNRFGTGA
ncbi:hypothetical protein [Streptomyces sp. NBC_00724]|uniref:hypothetical protein n=1 Tax=Streptomyces sp. NBC_00724 TaxID=2975812 RepID=UPI002ED4AFA1|nr:hypothetical protein OHB17_42850 [Streptomyces sp. NBC_00724]